MSGRAQVVAVVFAAVLLIGAVQVLRWTGDEIGDLDFRPDVPAEAGEILDPIDAAWLDRVPDRSLVDPEALAGALALLDVRVAAVVVFRPDGGASAVTTRVQIPGWMDTTDASVLIGARQRATIPTPADRDAFIDVVIRDLRAAGWRMSTTRLDVIQTDYPIVTPGPVDIVIDGESPLGTLSIVAPAEGQYRLTFAVDGDQLSS